MSTDMPIVVVNKENALDLEREKLKPNGKKVADIVKGVAIAYVGFQLGLAALRFIGRRLGGKRAPDTGASRSQRQQSTTGAALSTQQSAGAAAGEDVWAVIDASAPSTPDGYKPIVNAVLPCSPQELYGILFSSAGTELYLKQHRELGKQWDLVATGWRRASGAAALAGADAAAVAPADGSLLGATSVFEWVVGQPGYGGFTRLLTFWNPKKPPSTTDTRCVQRQQFCVYRGGVLVFSTAMNMLDIPFKECFTVNTFWRVAPGPSPGTSSLALNLKVNFIKRAMGVGGIISATTFRETSAFFNAFVANVDSRLRAIREQTAAPLPMPLPVSAVAAGPRGLRTASLVSRAPLVSPFAAAAGGAPDNAAAAAGGAAVAPQRSGLPAWKQVRALLVFALLAFTLLHQLHLGQEIAAMRGGGGEQAAEAEAGGGGVSGGGLVAVALGPVVTAAGSLHAVLKALVERLGGRVPAPPQA